MRKNQKKRNNHFVKKCYYFSYLFIWVRSNNEARKKDKRKIVNDINQVLKKNVEQKCKPTGTNSFVAPQSAYEYQTDLFFINDMKS